MSTLTLKNTQHTRKHEDGFTLIELSIVLVIIGLIVGGVLVGQDLIKAAEQRATLAQIEKYNTAVNTFRGKFGGIPGVLAGASALSFALVTTAPSGAAGVGDGNGIIQDSNTTNYSTPVGEPNLFWLELSNAGLIDGSFGSDVTQSTGVTTATTAATDMPLAKLGRNNYVIVGSSNGEGINAFGVMGVSAITPGAAATATYTGKNYLTPLESYNMDKKVDDGMPNTGAVQARDGTKSSITVSILEQMAAANAAPWNATPTTTAACTTTGASATNTSDTYALSTAGVSPATTPNCSLRFRFN